MSARLPARLMLAAALVLLAGLGALLLGSTTVAPVPGQASLGPADVWGSLTGADVPDGVRRIVLEVRLPRVLTGLLVGALLAVAGVLFQALLRNDLAEPYLVGVGPGAALGVTLAALAAGGEHLPAPWLRGGCAFLGAVGLAVLIFLAARRAGRVGAASLLLHGLALGLLVQALATGLLYVTVARWDVVMRWLLGSLVSADYGDVLRLAVVLALGLAVVLWRARDLDALSLGEDGAWLLGVDARRAYPLLGGVACLFSAAAIATAGLIGFVGLVVPHLTRRWAGAPHRGLLAGAALMGAGLLVLADALARILAPPLEVPPGLLTAALGAPVLLALLRRP